MELNFGKLLFMIAITLSNPFCLIIFWFYFRK